MQGRTAWARRGQGSLSGVLRWEWKDRRSYLGRREGEQIGAERRVLRSQIKERVS